MPTAILSRGLCGVAGQTLIVNLPGSPGGVRDGLAVLTDVVHHALDQLGGQGPSAMTRGCARCAHRPSRSPCTEHEELVAHHAAGAVVGFAGVVRDHDGGRTVIRLEYSARIRTAEQTLAEVACRGRRAVRRGARDRRRATGWAPLQIGDAALVAAVAADHRGAAFETCARLVDAVKERLPVWKHQFFADGTEEWVNSA